MLSPDLVRQAVARMLDGGAVSFKTLRLQLEQRLGRTLKHCKAQIRRMAEQALDKVAQKHDSPRGNTCCMPDGAMSDATGRGRLLFTLVTDVAGGCSGDTQKCWDVHGVWEPLPQALRRCALLRRPSRHCSLGALLPGARHPARWQNAFGHDDWRRRRWLVYLPQ